MQAFAFFALQKEINWRDLSVKWVSRDSIGVIPLIAYKPEKVTAYSVVVQRDGHLISGVTLTTARENCGNKYKLERAQKIRRKPSKKLSYDCSESYL